MRTFSNIAATAALLAVATAGDAPVVDSSSVLTGITYTATLPNTGVDAVTGAVIGSIAPGGAGTNFQVSFYNLPGTSSFQYGLYSGRVSNGDCSGAGAVLDPFAGATADCTRNQASCQVGALSAKHGDAKIVSGGAGTGYFAGNYVDKYVSIDPSNEAFFGKGSIVITDSTGAAVACANFINASKAVSTGNGTMTESSGSSMSSTTMASNGGAATGSSQQSGSSSSSSTGAAVRTAAPFVGAGVLGMAALLI